LIFNAAAKLIYVIFGRMKSEKEHQKNPDIKKLITENWLPAYTWVLIANAVYILIFFIIMKIFS